VLVAPSTSRSATAKKTASIFLAVFLGTWGILEPLGLRTGFPLWTQIAVGAGTVAVLILLLRSLRAPRALSVIRRVDIPRDTWIKLLADAEREFDSLAMASWHYIEHPDFFSVLEQRLREGACTYRFFLLAPDSPAAINRDREENKARQARGRPAQDTLRGRILRSRDTLWEWIQRPEHDVYRNRVKVYQYDCAPTYTLVRADNEMFVSAYLYVEEGDQTPTFLLRRDESSGAFNAYLADLDQLLRTGLATPFVGAGTSAA